MKWLDGITDMMDMNLQALGVGGASLVAQLVKNQLAMQETWCTVIHRVPKTQHLNNNHHPFHVIQPNTNYKHLLITFYALDSSVGKESACNAGDPDLIPG